MATNGKHMAKNNPKVSGKTIIASAELLALLVSLSIGTKTAINVYEKNEEKKELRRFEATEFAENFNIESLYNRIASQYNIYQGNGNLNTVGKVFEYFHNKITNPNLSEEEKIYILQSALKEENLSNEILSYINGNDKNIIYDEEEIKVKSLEAVTKNQDLMHQIREASDAYHVPEAILVGIIADNTTGENVTQQSIGQSYHNDWNKLSSDRSSHNYSTGKDDQLKGWNGPNSVMHLAAILANSIKEENANLYRAIIDVKVGPNHFNYQNNYNDLANKILTYASNYLSDKRFSLDYNSVVEGMNYSTTFESSNYQEYLVSVVNSVINILDTEIVQYYDNGVSLH